MPPTLAEMETEEAREAAAAGLRALNHAFAAHELDDGALAAITDTAHELTRRIDKSPLRDRLTLMRNRPDGSVLGGRGFEDRAVGGTSNPTSIELEVRYDDDEVVADSARRWDCWRRARSWPRWPGSSACRRRCCWGCCRPSGCRT